MAKIYEYKRHPRAAELEAHEPVKAVDLRRVNHQNLFVRMNARFGLKITMVVGTMWCSCLFTVVALFALPSAVKQGTYFIVV